MAIRSAIDGHTRCSIFAVAGGCDESFVSIATTEGSSFTEALAELTVRYSSALGHLGLSDTTAVFSRVFLSGTRRPLGLLRWWLLHVHVNARLR